MLKRVGINAAEMRMNHYPFEFSGGMRQRVVIASALVMYKGKVVESGNVDELYETPKHDYTRLLLSAIPSVDPDERLNPLSRDSLGLS